MNKRAFVFVSLAAILVVAFVVFRPSHRANAPSPTAANPPTKSLTVRRDSAGLAQTNLAKLLTIVSNPEKTGRGAIASYEAREIIADRLRTNEAFRLWATNQVWRAVARIMQNPKLHIYGTSNLTTNNIAVTVDTQPVGGLLAVACYYPDTNGSNLLTFNVEGGTNPVIEMIQDNNHLIDLLPPQHWGLSDWSGATRPLDPAFIQEIAQAAYTEMSGNPLPANLVFHCDTGPITDRTVHDPNVIVTGSHSMTVATTANQRYPFASFGYKDPIWDGDTFSGQIIQTQSGQAEIVELFYPPWIQQSIMELASVFLSGESPDWPGEVLSEVGTTPPDQVLKKLWQMPNH